MLKISIVDLLLVGLIVHCASAGIFNISEHLGNLTNGADGSWELKLTKPAAAFVRRGSNCALDSGCFKNKLYYFENAVKRTAVEAALYCNHLNMTLISVEDYEENYFIVNSLNSANCTSEDYWTSGQMGWNNTFRWGTGARFNYTNWKSDAPSYYNDRRCVYYHNDYLQWKDQTCSNKFFYICESSLSCL